MLTMDEYKVVDKILANFLEEGDLIKVKEDVYEVINIIDTPDGWDIVVLDNYYDQKIISVPEASKVSLVLPDSYE
jgi:hypothetical protein